MTKKIWIDTYKIHSYEIDINGRATLPILCKFMQESAWHHAENLGVGFSQLIKQKLAWILAQQRILMTTYPHWDETITVHTWPSGRGRLSYFRDFKIVNAADEILGLATTKWYAIDLVQRHPINLAEYFTFERVESDNVLPHTFDKLPAPRSNEQINTFHVRFSDLDVNEHVNNVRYIEWILDGFSLEFRKAHQLRDIEISYLAEALYDDQLQSFSESDGNSMHNHSLRRVADAKELCRAVTKWLGK